jgi:hypothetical protein
MTTWARRTCEKSIALDPGNTNAVQIVRELKQKRATAGK